MKAAPAENAHEESIHQIDENVPDPYKANLIEPAVCPICFAVFKDGRWQWAARWPIDAHQRVCQACHRTRDRHPAGMPRSAAGLRWLTEPRFLAWLDAWSNTRNSCIPSTG
jgi:hypothetical protein